MSPAGRLRCLIRCTSPSSARATSAGHRSRRRYSPARSMSADCQTWFASPARGPGAGMPAPPPTTGPAACCANTATPPHTAPRRSPMTTCPPTWSSRWAAITPACCAKWVFRPAGFGCCGRSIRGRRRTPSTSKTRTTAPTRTSKTCSPSSRRPCPGCTFGWTSSWPAGESRARQAMNAVKRRNMFQRLAFLLRPAWRRVTATGHYLPNAQVLARLRVIDGDPAFEVLLPFAVDGGPVVLVDRGYVRPEQGSKVPTMPTPPTTTVTITGRLRDSEPVVQGKDPFRQDGAQQVYSINTKQVSAVTGVPVAGSYLQLVEDQPGGLGVISLPHLDAGPFLSYGIQWIAFGIVAPILLGYFVYAEIGQRRRDRAAPSDAAAAPLTTEDKLADRYGRRR